LAPKAWEARVPKPAESPKTMAIPNADESEREKPTAASNDPLLSLPTKNKLIVSKRKVQIEVRTVGRPALSR